MSKVNFNLETVNVLVVDDHEPMRKAIHRLLTKMRFKYIHECNDGSEALEILEAQPIDIVLGDLYMRKVNGFKLLEFIRNRAIGNDVPFMVITGEANRDDIVTVSDLGADDYLLKPFQSEDFEKKVVNLLNKYFAPSPLSDTLRKVDNLLYQKNFQLALETIQEALKIDNTSVRAKYTLAIILEKLGKTQSAIEILNANISSNPDYYRNYKTLADLYLKLSRTDEALQAMKKELELHPKQPKRQSELAKLYMDKGEFSNAIEYFRNALRIDIKNPTALLGIGQSFAKDHNLDKAIYYFKRLRRYHPKSTMALEAIVKYAMAADQPKIAEYTLRDEKHKYRDRLDTYLVLGKFYASTERFEDAKQNIEDFIVKSQDFNIAAYQLKVMIHIKLKEFNEALEALKAIIAKQPDLESYKKMIEILLSLGKPHDAIRAVHKSLPLRDDVVGTFCELLNLYFKTNELTKCHYILARLAKIGVHKKEFQIIIKNTESALQNRLTRIKKIAS